MGHQRWMHLIGGYDCVILHISRRDDTAFVSNFYIRNAIIGETGVSSKFRFMTDRIKIEEGVRSDLAIKRR